MAKHFLAVSVAGEPFAQPVNATDFRLLPDRTVVVDDRAGMALLKLACGERPAEIGNARFFDVLDDGVVYRGCLMVRTHGAWAFQFADNGPPPAGTPIVLSTK